MSFAEKLKKLREERNMTQEDLANYLRITRQAVGNYEQGLRFPKDENTLNAIADLFGVSLDYLMGRVAVKNNIGDSYVFESTAAYEQEKLIALKQLLSTVEDMPIETIKKLDEVIYLLRDVRGNSSNKTK